MDKKSAAALAAALIAAGWAGKAEARDLRGYQSLGSGNHIRVEFVADTDDEGSCGAGSCGSSTPSEESDKESNGLCNVNAPKAKKTAERCSGGRCPAPKPDEDEEEEGKSKRWWRRKW